MTTETANYKGFTPQGERHLLPAFTYEQVRQAFVEEAREGNRLFDLGSTLTDADYEALGYLRAAFDRLTKQAA